MLRLEWAVGIDTEIRALRFAKLGQFDPELFQVQSGNFFVEVFRKTVNANLIVVFPQIELSQSLV